MTLQNTATFGNFKVNWNVIVMLYNTERDGQTEITLNLNKEKSLGMEHNLF